MTPCKKPPGEFFFEVELEVVFARCGVPFLPAPGPRGGRMREAYVTIYDIASIARWVQRPKLTPFKLLSRIRQSAENEGKFRE